ncbi:MAG: FHA domain-containing protein [Dehalococcoidia bacterium]|jgi:pSer/pThr/pTyr-binding forkhead associated (FHA) protein|nr:FHA domain-containing protein [Dehalococcoidia bacterium]
MAVPPEAILIVRSGVQGVERVALTGPRHVIGRRAPADIVLDNEYVSGNHAEIVFDGESFTIRDLGSKNGTFVDGKPVGDGPVALRSGGRIDLGRAAVVLTFQTADSTMTRTASEVGIDTHSSEVRAGWLTVHRGSREVLVGGEPLEAPLSRKQFDVLAPLYEARGRVCSWQEIAAQGWPEYGGAPVSHDQIAQLTYQIRLKIDPQQQRPDSIKSVQGIGYRLDL